MVNAMKSRNSGMVVKHRQDLSESSYLTFGCTNDPQSVGNVQTISNSYFSEDNNYVSLQDIEVSVKVKGQNQHRCVDTLPYIRKRARAWQNISWSGSRESKFVTKLNEIETEITSTICKLSKMRRVSIDILTGIRDDSECWGQVETIINDLAAKKHSLEMEQLETYMNLQSQLMVPTGTVEIVGERDYKRKKLDDSAFSTNLTRSENKKTCDVQRDEENLTKRRDNEEGMGEIKEV